MDGCSSQMHTLERNIQPFALWSMHAYMYLRFEQHIWISRFQCLTFKLSCLFFHAATPPQEALRPGHRHGCMTRLCTHWSESFLSRSAAPLSSPSERPSIKTLGEFHKIDSSSSTSQGFLLFVSSKLHPYISPVSFLTFPIPYEIHSSTSGISRAHK